MKHVLVSAAVIASLAPATAWSQPAAADKPICVRARNDTDYNARPISQHDVLVRNAVGDKRALRLGTTCIHIYPDAFVAVHAAMLCVSKGDDVAVRTIDGRGEQCRISSVTPFIEGSIKPPYK